MEVLLNLPMIKLEPTTVLDTVMLNALMISSLSKEKLMLMAGTQAPQILMQEQASTVLAAWSSIFGRQIASLKLSLPIHALKIAHTGVKEQNVVMMPVVRGSKESVTKMVVTSPLTETESLIFMALEATSRLILPNHSQSSLNSTPILEQMMERLSK